MLAPAIREHSMPQLAPLREACGPHKAHASQNARLLWPLRSKRGRIVPLRSHTAKHSPSFLARRVVAPSSRNDEANRNLRKLAMTPQIDTVYFMKDTERPRPSRSHHQAGAMGTCYERNRLCDSHGPRLDAAGNRTVHGAGSGPQGWRYRVTIKRAKRDQHWPVRGRWRGPHHVRPRPPDAVARALAG